MLTTLTNAPK